MNIKESLNSSYISLKSNKMRSFLTMIGVVIGVFSVVSMVSLGRGIENYISDQFDELGSNLLFISPGTVGLTDDPASYMTQNKLDEKHIELIDRYAEDVVLEQTPYVAAGKNAENKTKSYFAEFAGVNSKSLEIVNYELDHGRVFTSTEEKNNARVVILGPDVANELFGNPAPLGERVKIDERAYEVIGTFEPKGASYDDQIIIPYTTAMEDFDIKNYSSILVKLKEGADLDTSVRKIELALMRDLEDDEFTVMSPQDLLASIGQILNVLTMGLGAIAGISLLVGGIGIMNIMLVSVTERTREIGLRKAVGADNNAIAYQFILEAVIISFIGGLFGLLLAWLLTLGVSSFIRAEIPFYAVIVAFGFSLLVGVVFGTYPALKASKKDPIEALRYE